MAENFRLMEYGPYYMENLLKSLLKVSFVHVDTKRFDPNPNQIQLKSQKPNTLEIYVLYSGTEK